MVTRLHRKDYTTDCNEYYSSLSIVVVPGSKQNMRGRHAYKARLHLEDLNRASRAIVPAAIPVSLTWNTSVYSSGSRDLARVSPGAPHRFSWDHSMKRHFAKGGVTATGGRVRRTGDISNQRSALAHQSGERSEGMIVDATRYSLSRIADSPRNSERSPLQLFRRESFPKNSSESWVLLVEVQLCLKFPEQCPKFYYWFPAANHSSRTAKRNILGSWSMKKYIKQYKASIEYILEEKRGPRNVC